MNDKVLPQEFRRIWILMGELGTAVWKRIEASEEGASAAFLKALGDVYPKSAEEIAAWNELTAPRNHEALHQYIAYFGDNVSKYAKELYNALVEESDRRAATQAGGVSSAPSCSGT